MKLADMPSCLGGEVFGINLPVFVPGLNREETLVANRLV